MLGRGLQISFATKDRDESYLEAKNSALREAATALESLVCIYVTLAFNGGIDTIIANALQARHTRLCPMVANELSLCKVVVGMAKLGGLISLSLDSTICCPSLTPMVSGDGLKDGE